MFYPHCNFGKPTQNQSGSAEQFQPMDIANFLESIAAAAEPWLSVHLNPSKSGTPGGNTNNSKPSSPSVSTTDNKYEVKVDVTNFGPEDINVKVVENSIVIEGKHGEKEDKYGFISQQITRRFVLPEGVILDKMTCTMSEDKNTLLISAPRIVEKPATNERPIPINFVGQSEAADLRTNSASSMD